MIDWFSQEAFDVRPFPERMMLVHHQIRSLDRRKREYKKVGWVYVTRNTELRRPAFKIGETSRFPVERAQELSAETGVLGSFELVYFIHAGDRQAAEAQVHASLASSRVSNSKEFFAAPLNDVLKALDSAASAFPIWCGTRKNFRPLRQPFLVRVRQCPQCTKSTAVRELLIPVQAKCAHCKLNVT